MNSIEFLTSSNSGNAPQGPGSASQTVRQMRERLEDPQQRAAVRAEQRAQILESHRDLGRMLDLDPVTEAKLMELLTDQQMDQLDEFHCQFKDGAAPTQADPWQEQLHTRADQATRRVQTLRELLGQEKLERYQAFQRTFNERIRVNTFDARLDSAHKLSADQKERLIEFFQERTVRDLDQHRRTTNIAPPLGAPFRELPSAEEMQRRSQLLTIAGNEEIWRGMSKSDRLLQQGAAKVLTAPQLAALAQMHAEDASNLQRWIEKARVQAGLSPDIPDHPETSQPLRTRLARQVRLSIKLAVNRNEPTSFIHVGPGGEPVTFDSAEDLLVEATPTLYDDETFELQVLFYEAGCSGKRLIGQLGQMGAIARAPADSSSLNYQGSGGTVIIGSKGYAIELSAQVEQR